MRWVPHWIIGADCLPGRRSLPYQLGCLLPDWIDRHPIHRTDETLEIFLRRAEAARRLPKGALRDWRVGLLAHFLCDYCTEAHNGEYRRLFRHRVYEVRHQKRVLALRREGSPLLTRIESVPVPPALLDPETGAEAFQTALRDFVAGELDALHAQIRALNSERWYTDRRIMDLDIRYAHRLLRAFLRIMGDTETGKESDADGR